MRRRILMTTVSVGVVVLAIVTYKKAGDFVGAALFIIGWMNVLFSRKIGQSVHYSSRIFPTRLAPMWRHVDVREIANLYRAIGIIMVSVGAIDWIVFFFSLVPHDQPIAWFGSGRSKDVR